MSFCRPAAHPPSPLPRTKHRADGLTRRSNLSLLPFSYPPRFSTVPFLGLVLLILRVLLPRFATAAQPPNTPGSPFYTLCHFAPPLVRACRSLPHPPQSCPPFSLMLSLSFVFLVVCVFVRFLIFSLSLFLSWLPHCFVKSRQKSPQDDQRATHPSKERLRKSGFSLDQRETRKCRNDKGSIDVLRGIKLSINEIKIIFDCKVLNFYNIKFLKKYNIIKNILYSIYIFYTHIS